MWDECVNFGAIIEIKIPRPIFVDRSAENSKIDSSKLVQEALIEDRKAAADPRYIKTSERRKAKSQKELLELDIYSDKRNYDLPAGFGNVYVKFLSPLDCLRALKELNGVLYNNNQIETFYWIENLFDESEFGLLPAIKLKEMGKEFEGLTNLPIEFMETRKSNPISLK